MVKLPHVWSRLRKPSLAPKSTESERTEKSPGQTPECPIPSVAETQPANPPEKPKQTVLAPKPIRAERTEKLPEQVLLVMASEQRRVFIAVFLFFLSMPMGLAALLGSGLYLLGPALLALCLALWMACTTAFFLFVAYLSYRPVKEITTWLEANVPEDAK